RTAHEPSGAFRSRIPRRTMSAETSLLPIVPRRRLAALPPAFDRRRLDLDVPLELLSERSVLEPDRLADALIRPVLARGLDVQDILAAPDRLAPIVLAVPDDVVLAGLAGRPGNGGDQVGVIDQPPGPIAAVPVLQVGDPLRAVFRRRDPEDERTDRVPVLVLDPGGEVRALVAPPAGVRPVDLELHEQLEGIAPGGAVAGRCLLLLIALAPGVLLQRQRP